MSSEHGATNLGEADEGVAPGPQPALQDVSVAPALGQDPLHHVVRPGGRGVQGGELEGGGGQQREVARGRGQRGGEYRVTDGLRSLDTLGRVLGYAADYQVLGMKTDQKRVVTLNIKSETELF